MTFIQTQEEIGNRAAGDMVQWVKVPGAGLDKCVGIPGGNPLSQRTPLSCPLTFITTP